MLTQLMRKFNDSIDSIKKLDVISALVTEVTKHTLLDSLYIFKHSISQYGYILQDKKSNEIIAIDCGNYKSQRFNIEALMKQTGGGFTTLLITSPMPHSTEGVREWQRVHPDLKIIRPGSTEDGKIIYIGDLCIYIMHTPGPTDQNTSYVITEVSESSTKTPIVFTGDVLTTGGCGKGINYQGFYNSLMKLKNLPNETLIFPGFERAAENLMFAKLIDGGNQFVNSKLEEVKENKEKNIGQLLGQERLYNPFFRCDQKYFQKLFEVEDSLSCFIKMKKMMEKLVKIKEV